jgi:hypothetical protein
MLHVFLTVGAILVSIQLWALIARALDAIFSLLVKGTRLVLPFVGIYVLIFVPFALAMVLTHGWAWLVFLGAVYLFWIFRGCRWALRAWSRRKLTGSWRKPKLAGDGDISYFGG